ncbi:flippase [Treponema sp. HNW]|uniref:flippase n=1 Tax=Treponema sp. HNW TaxID=3116654 RepID=UPI003D117C66
MVKQSLTRNILFSSLKRLFEVLVPIITIPYLSKTLLPDGIGQVNFVKSYIAYFVIIAEFGLSGYGTREITRQRNSKETLSKVTKELFSISLISTFAAYILFFISLFLFNKLQPYLSLLLLYSISIFLTTLGMEWLFRGLGEFKYISIRYLIFRILMLILMFVFVKNENNIKEYFLVFMVGSSLPNIFNFLYSFKFINWKTVVPLVYKHHLKSLLFFWWHTISITIYELTDVTMLGLMSTNTEVAYYSTTHKFVFMVNALLCNVTMTAIPHAVHYIEVQNSEGYMELLKNIGNFLLMFSIPLSFLCFLLSKDIIVLFCGLLFLPSYIIMNILALSICPFLFAGFIGNLILLPYRKEKITMFVNLCAAILNCILNYILILYYSAIGAAISSIISQYIVCLFYYVYTRSMISYKHLLSNIMQYFCASISMIIIVLLLKYSISTLLLRLILCTVLGILVYMLSLILMKNIYMINFYKKILTRRR